MKMLTRAIFMCANKGISLETLAETIKISFGIILSQADFLANLGFLENQNGNFRLTKSGRAKLHLAEALEYYKEKLSIMWVDTVFLKFQKDLMDNPSGVKFPPLAHDYKIRTKIKRENQADELLGILAKPYTLNELDPGDMELIPITRKMSPKWIPAGLKIFSLKQYLKGSAQSTPKKSLTIQLSAFAGRLIMDTEKPVFIYVLFCTGEWVVLTEALPECETDMPKPDLRLPEPPNLEILQNGLSLALGFVREQLGDPARSSGSCRLKKATILIRVPVECLKFDPVNRIIGVA